jgi:outer membrane receptor for Fe3+-dicitrate
MLLYPYKPSDKFSVTFQYTYMDYLAHQPGGLTDAAFAADPRQSVRARNWFKVKWNLGAVLLDYQITDKLKFNSRFLWPVCQPRCVEQPRFYKPCRRGRPARSV